MKGRDRGTDGVTLEQRAAEPRSREEPPARVQPSGAGEPAAPVVPSRLRLRNTSLVLPSILLATDMLVLECAFLCVYWARFLSGWFPVPKGVPDLGIYLVGSLGVQVLFVCIFYSLGMYDLRRRPGVAEDITGVARGLGLSTLLLAAAAFSYRG